MEVREATRRYRPRVRFNFFLLWDSRFCYLFFGGGDFGAYKNPLIFKI